MSDQNITTNTRSGASINNLVSSLPSLTINSDMPSFKLPSAGVLNLNLNVGQLIMLVMYVVPVFWVGYISAFLVDHVIGVIQDSLGLSKPTEGFVKLPVGIQDVGVAVLMSSIQIASMNVVYSILKQITSKIIGEIYGLNASFVGGGVFFAGGVAQGSSNFRKNFSVVHRYMSSVF